MAARQVSRFGIIVATLLVVTFATSSKGSPWNFGNSVAETYANHIGGNTSTVEQFPYHLSLEFITNLGITGVCGGAIVSDNWVLTVAHCVYHRFPINKYQIRVGISRQYLKDNEGSAHDVQVLEFHPDFSFKYVDYDIAVIQVKEKFEFSTRVQAIPLPKVPEAEFLDFNLPAVATGWGRPNRLSGRFAKFLESAALPLVPRDECYRRVKVLDWPKGVDPSVNERMICAGGGPTGFACAGDSGGPLVHKGHLIGLSSWNNRCRGRTPNVFTNLMNKEIRAFIIKYIPNL